MQDLLNSYKTMRCNVSLKIHFLESHLNFCFPENLGEVSDEHGERYHQDIMAMEKRHQGKWTASMLADSCWALNRNVPEAKYRRGVIGLNILQKRFCLFHEHIKCYFGHLNSSVSLKSYLVENCRIHI